MRRIKVGYTDMPQIKYVRFQAQKIQVVDSRKNFNKNVFVFHSFIGENKKGG